MRLAVPIIITWQVPLVVSCPRSSRGGEVARALVSDQTKAIRKRAKGFQQADVSCEVRGIATKRVRCAPPHCRFGRTGQCRSPAM